MHSISIVNLTNIIKYIAHSFYLARNWFVEQIKVVDKIIVVLIEKGDPKKIIVKELFHYLNGQSFLLNFHHLDLVSFSFIF